MERAAEEGENVHKHFTQFSSDLTNFKYGDVRNKRHHKGKILLLKFILCSMSQKLSQQFHKNLIISNNVKHKKYNSSSQ